MLPLKLVRSLVFGETAINNPFILSRTHHHHHHHDSDLDEDGDDSDGTGNSTHHRDNRPRNRQRRRRRSKSKNAIEPKTPFLLFVPTKELVTDTYRLATIAREMGMDLYPTPSLSHIIFSYPTSSSSTAKSSLPSSWSSVSLLPNDAVPLPFPSLTTASITHLRSFVSLSRALFKLVFVSSSFLTNTKNSSFDSSSNWDCCSFSLLSRVTGDRITSMDGFSRALAGMGWTLFKTQKNPGGDPGDNRVSGKNPMYLFRKVDSRRVRVLRSDGDGGAVSGECRVRELRLPPLDFRNAPLRILQYIVLMTDDIFYLA